MPKMVENDPLDSVQVAFRVHILHVRRLDIKLIIWAEVLIILIDGDFCHADELKRAGTCREAYRVRAVRLQQDQSHMPSID